MTGSPPLSDNEIELMRQELDDVQLSMTCVLERFVISGTDSYNQPTGDWQTSYEGQCWLYERERFRSFGLTDIQGPNINVVLGGPRLILPAGTDVTERDRVASVVDMFGVQRLKGYPNPGDIREIMKRLLDVVCLIESRE